MIFFFASEIVTFLTWNLLNELDTTTPLYNHRYKYKYKYSITHQTAGVKCL